MLLIRSTGPQYRKWPTWTASGIISSKSSSFKTVLLLSVLCLEDELLPGSERSTNVSKKAFSKKIELNRLYLWHDIHATVLEGGRTEPVCVCLHKQRLRGFTTGMLNLSEFSSICGLVKTPASWRWMVLHLSLSTGDKLLRNVWILLYD